MSRIRNTDRNWCNLPLPPLIAPPAELKYGFSGRRETLQKEQNFLRQVPGGYLTKITWPESGKNSQNICKSQSFFNNYTPTQGTQNNKNYK
jgi:hypothetical protein